ncbi:MAG: AraC family transcriptional regulator [Sphingobium sp.]|nr:MAG: AraC family transcriptional regulator [Sphingobium sp.]
MLDVTVVLLSDGLSSTYIMPVEIFHSAGALWNALQGTAPTPAFRVRTVAPGGGQVKSPYGLSLHAEARLDDIAQTDIIIVPTSGMDLDAKLAENRALIPWLRRHHDQGAYIVGVCMGSAYLAEAGLLDGRIATTHWAVSDDLSRRYPDVLWRPDLFVTEDSRVVCSGGVCGSIDVSLYLVEKFCGHDIAVQCAKALLLPMPRILQSGYAMLPVSQPHDDACIRAVEEHMQARYRDNLSTQMLAALAGLGTRTFVRRFKAATGRVPAEYLQALRIQAAKAMLEKDNASIQSIATATGYNDVAFFRALFKRSTGMTPADYRAHFAPMHVRGEAMPAIGA